jgi:hypothetical protein
MLKNIKIKCKYNCGKTLSYEDMKRHLLTCENKTYLCEFEHNDNNNNIQFKGNKNEILEHLKNNHPIHLLIFMECYYMFKNTINKIIKCNKNDGENENEDETVLDFTNSNNNEIISRFSGNDILPVNYIVNEDSDEDLLHRFDDRHYAFVPRFNRRGNIRMRRGGNHRFVRNIEDTISFESIEYNNINNNNNNILENPPENNNNPTTTPTENHSETSEDPIPSSIYCATGGKNCIISIIDIISNSIMRQLYGHRSEIYTLKFYNLNYKILISGSNDSTIRIWNIITGEQLVLFGGPQGAKGGILSIDINFEGQYLVSGSIDTCVRIYDLFVEKIKKRIESCFEKIDIKQIKTLIKSRPIFCCNTLHENYIDWVKFYGNIIFSKSVDGVVKEWLPIFRTEKDTYYLLNVYKYEIKNQIWFVKFYYNEMYNFLITGNDYGKLFLFYNNIELNSENNEENLKERNKKIKECDSFETKIYDIIRIIDYSVYYNKIVVAFNNGEILITELNEKLPI